MFVRAFTGRKKCVRVCGGRCVHGMFVLRRKGFKIRYKKVCVST